MKILLSGHAFGPDRGTEPGFAWNWAEQLSTAHDVWVMTHPQFRDSVEAALSRVPNPRLRVVWVNIPKWFDPFKPERGQQWVRLHYALWQIAALRAARRLHARHSFDVIHHVTLGTINVPPLLGLLNVPFVWGPVGGGQKAPRGFASFFGVSWFRELIRNVYVRTLPLNPFLRFTAKHTDVALATNQETEALLYRAGAPSVRMFIDGGVRACDVSSTPPVRNDREHRTFLWAGRIEPRKGLALALTAFASADLDVRARLLVAGEGSDMPRCQRLAEQLGICERVAFLGKVAWRDMPALFRESDIFLFTSLQDSFGSVLLEAMAQALPIIALDHQGPAAFLPAGACLKVAVGPSHDVATRLAAAMNSLAGSPDLQRRMGEAAWRFARLQTWSERARRMIDIYGSITHSGPGRATRLREISPESLT